MTGSLNMYLLPFLFHPVGGTVSVTTRINGQWAQRLVTLLLWHQYATWWSTRHRTQHPSISTHTWALAHKYFHWTVHWSWNLLRYHSLLKLCVLLKLTGPQSETVHLLSQGGPSHSWLSIGWEDLLHSLISMEHRTSRVWTPREPHRAEHWHAEWHAQTHTHYS